MRTSRLRDLAGFGFFLFATLIAGVAAWQHPSILAWLYAIHNGLFNVIKLASRFITEREFFGFDSHNSWK